MKKTSLLLAALLVLAGMSALLSLSIAADDPLSPLPTPTFTYDFTKGLTDEIVDPNNRIQMSYQNADGYVTFVSEGDDPYFRFCDGYEPNVTTENLAYAVIKYRTTAAIASGEFFTNRRSGPQWGGDGTHVSWSYRNDGNWHAALIDTTTAWGSTVGDSLYAFRLDPLATGAKAGDTVDIAYICFFADRASAIAYGSAEFPDDFQETESETEAPTEAPTYTITFTVDGKTIYTVTYSEGATSIEEPVVPLRPGYEGKWADYQLNNTDLTVEAVYTPTATETVPPMPESETETETEAPTAAPNETETTDPATQTEALETNRSTDKTDKTDKNEGCGSSIALSALAVLLPVAALTLRRKD